MTIRTEIEIYRSYLHLQARFENMYQALETQYRNCGCDSCKMDLAAFTIEYVRLNAVLEQIERRLPPGYGLLAIGHSIPQQ